MKLIDYTVALYEPGQTVATLTKKNDPTFGITIGIVNGTMYDLDEGENLVYIIPVAYKRFSGIYKELWRPYPSIDCRLMVYENKIKKNISELISAAQQ